MKKKEKRLILILLVILVIILTIFFLTRRGEKKVNEENNNAAQNTVENEKFVQLLEDGTKLNTSNKLNETKNVDGIEIGNIQFTYKDGQTVLLADVTNNSGKAVDMTLLDIKLLDEEGNEIITVGGIISPMEVGEKTQLNTSMTMDYANAYDFQIIMKK